MQINWNPRKDDIRNFGIMTLIMLPLISYLLLWKQHINITWAFAISGIGAIFFLVCLFSHRTGRIIYLSLMLLVYPIGLIVSFLMIVLLYYAIIAPMGIIFKFLKKDPLRREFDESVSTYWVKHKDRKDINSYYRLS
jgi:hypothetical protein